MKITRLRLSDGEHDLSCIAPLARASITIELIVEQDGVYTCGYMLTIWSERMRRIARVEVDDKEFAAKAGDRRRVDVDLSPFMLKFGKYYLSVSVYDRSSGHQSGGDTRFDVLSKCLTFTVATEYPDSQFLFAHSASWKFSQ